MFTIEVEGSTGVASQKHEEQSQPLTHAQTYEESMLANG